MTGSSAHLEQLQAFARGKGYELKRDGLYRGKRLVASVTEEDIYEALDLQFIEPELREGRNEIEKSCKARSADARQGQRLAWHTSLPHDGVGRNRDT